ncbi:hypothetical protein [Denitromonas halophila]|uniref:Uncharacterized protein n=1 Tax=Denitromonas halophila TaxID=1629404 RepID=A0A557QFC9_9RHOO|nr:hypothetical protein [Denitromonas halophila]TVO51610.1 hypothetical protein FHP91_19295 [Denitromonas halophila]
MNSSLPTGVGAHPKSPLTTPPPTKLESDKATRGSDGRAAVTDRRVRMEFNENGALGLLHDAPVMSLS